MQVDEIVFFLIQRNAIWTVICCWLCWIDKNWVRLLWMTMLFESYIVLYSLFYCHIDFCFVKRRFLLSCMNNTIQNPHMIQYYLMHYPAWIPLCKWLVCIGIFQREIHLLFCLFIVNGLMYHVIDLGRRVKWWDGGFRNQEIYDC